jgi:hypothetical protein
VGVEVEALHKQMQMEVVVVVAVDTVNLLPKT